MKTGHVIDRLSAYMDGEAKDPEGIARHLQQCEECARRYMELSKLSAHLRALAPPQVQPAFLTRVMAHVRETDQVRQSRWRGRVAAVAVPALVLLVVAGTILLPRGGEGPSPAHPIAQVDAEAILAEIEQRLASGEDLNLRDVEVLGAPSFLVASTDFDAPAWPAGEPGVEGTDADWLEVLAEEDWLDGLAATLEANDDVYDVIGQFDETETDYFKELLVQYAKEELAS